MIATITEQPQMDALVADIVRSFMDLKFEPVLQSGFRRLERESSTRFAMQSDPLGNKWTPLAASTIKKKGHATILFETGRLRGSLTSPKHGDGIRQTWDEWPKAGLIYGTDVPYGMFHETGGPNLPRRPFMGMGERTLDLMTSDTADHALAGLIK